MKGKLIRNTLLLLIIPLVITLVIVFTNNRQYGFSATVDKNGTSYIETTNSANGSNKNKEFVETFNENYTMMMFSAILLVIIFVIFYNFLTKKKGW